MSPRLVSTQTGARIGKLAAAAASRWLPTQHSAVLGLLLVTWGCESSYLTEQPDPRLVATINALDAKIVLQGQEIANLERIYWSEKNCQKSKDKITSFVNEVQKGTPGVCLPMEMAKALEFMNSQPKAYVYLDKIRGFSGAHPARMTFLRDSLLKAEDIHPSTRILILVQPYAETPVALQESQAMGKTVVDRILNWLPATPNRPAPTILGPHLLPCNLRSEAVLSKMYTGSEFTKLNETLPGEPDPKQPRVRIWIFRTDCQ